MSNVHVMISQSQDNVGAWVVVVGGCGILATSWTVFYSVVVAGVNVAQWYPGLPQVLALKSQHRKP